MNRIDQYPGRWSAISRRDQKNPANVTAALARQMITPTARTHRVAPIEPSTISRELRRNRQRAHEDDRWVYQCVMLDRRAETLSAAASNRPS